MWFSCGVGQAKLAELPDPNTLLPIFYGSGRTCTEGFLLDHARFVADQVCGVAPCSKARSDGRVCMLAPPSCPLTRSSPCASPCVTLQLAHLKSAAFDNCKFVVQLKAKGMKFSERTLKLKAKMAAKDAREAERQQSKRVCVCVFVV